MSMLVRSPAITLQDLEFVEIPIEDRSTRGVPYIRWMRVGVPRIPPHVIGSVFYLYATQEDALAEENPGGTGFIVAYSPGFYPTSRIQRYYAVTNWHVACQGFPVIRLNTRQGEPDILDFDQVEWQFLPGKYDVAAIPLTLDKELHRFSSIGTYMFAQEGNHPAHADHIGVGEDVFMVGLFLDHEDHATGVPSARFGHVSMMPDQKATIKQSTGYDGASYVVDMHSRTGFSGSPVFAYRTFGSDLADYLSQGHPLEVAIHQVNQSRSGPPSITGRLKYKPLFKLLGIHWGQFPEKWELANAPSLAQSRKHLITEGAYIEGMSGMTCVIPAWQIKEVLDMPKFKAQRDAVYGGKAHSGPKPESA